MAQDAPPPPPPPPPPPLEAPEIFKVVEEMPSYEGGLEKLTEFIYSNLKYPESAKNKNIEGLVVIRYVVDVDGSLSDVAVIRDIGEKCGEEAERVLKLTNGKWIPGKQRGRKVKVQMNLPIRFKLDNEVEFVLQNSPRKVIDNKGDKFYNKGIAAYNKGKYKKAIKKFTKSISKNGRDISAIFNRAVTYQKMGMADETCSDIKKLEKLKYNAAHSLIKKYCE